MCRIGFLTYRHRNRLEALPYFKRLVRVGQTLGMTLYAFSVDDLDLEKRTVRALLPTSSAPTFKPTFKSVFKPENKPENKLEKENVWTQSRTLTAQTLPWPDIVYDFVRYHPTEQFARYRMLRSRNVLPSLYRGGSNKWRQYDILSRNSELLPHLPQTVRWKKGVRLSDVLTPFSGKPVLIKPINGTGGRGILSLDEDDVRRLTFESHPRASASDKEKVQALTLSSDRIVQEKLDLTYGDAIYDTRVLMQKNKNGSWQMTGYGTRRAHTSSIVTNLSRGGHALLTETFLQNIARLNVARTLQDIERLSRSVCETLDTAIGPLVELGLDLAITRDGRVYVLEANTKPDRMILLKTGQKEAFTTAHTRPLIYLCDMFTSGSLRAYKYASFQ
ncbi:MAG: YheC/YheD family protein [Candidatus Carbobacillus altaicus]|nr:YheC/YheD family protein [Candidatus Carbobacillus altaicus]